MLNFLHFIIKKMLLFNHPLVKIRHNYYVQQGNIKNIDTSLYELDELTFNILPKFLIIRENNDISFHWKTENYLFAGSYYWWEKGFVNLEKGITVHTRLNNIDSFKKSDIRIKKIKDNEFELGLEGEYKITKNDLKKIGLEDLLRYKNKKLEFFLFKPGYELNDLEKKLTTEFNKIKNITRTEYVITLDRLSEYLQPETYTSILKELFNNKEQQKEWVELGFIENIEFKDFQKFIDFIKNHDKLCIDTKFFAKDSVTYSTIHKLGNTELYDKDNKLDGLLIKGDNYHALRRLLYSNNPTTNKGLTKKE